MDLESGWYSGSSRFEVPAATRTNTIASGPYATELNASKDRAANPPEAAQVLSVTFPMPPRDVGKQRAWGQTENHPRLSSRTVGYRTGPSSRRTGRHDSRGVGRLCHRVRPLRPDRPITAGAVMRGGRVGRTGPRQ